MQKKKAVVKKKKVYVLEEHPAPFFQFIIWGMALLFNFYKVVLLSFPEPVASQIVRDIGLSREKLELLMVTSAHVMLIFQLPLGFFLDRFGPKKIGSISICIAAIGALVFSMSRSFEVALIGRILIGCGVSAAVINSLKLVSNWFLPVRFAVMVGFTVAFEALGESVGEYFIALFAEIFGWRSCLAHIALIGILYSLIYFVVVRDKVPGAKYNINPTIRKFTFPKSLKKCFKHHQTWFLAALLGLIQAPMIIFMGVWGVSFLKTNYSISSFKAVSINMIFFIGMAISAPTVAYFSTKLKKRKPFLQVGSLLTCVFLTISLFGAVIPLELRGFLLLILGVIAGTFPLIYTMIHERNVPNITGTVIAFAATGFSAFYILEFNLTLYLTNIFATTSPFILLPISAFIGFIISFFVRETEAQQRLIETYRR